MEMSKPVVRIIGPTTPATGGMETYIRELMQSKLSTEFDLQLFDISKPSIRKYQSRNYTGYSAVLKRSPFLSVASFALSFLFLARFVIYMFTRKADIVHIHTASYTSFWEKVLYILLCKWARVPVILHVHGAMFDRFYREQPGYVKRMIRFYLKQCEKVVVLSQYWFDFFSQLTNPDQLRIVANGVSVSDFAQQQFEKSGPPALLFLGELSRRKGIQDLIRVLPQVKQEIPELLVYIAGPGNLPELQAACKQEGIDSDIYFMGEIYGREKLQLLQSCWVYVLPSYAEGQPMAIIEAMAAGLAVVGTCVGGVPDMLNKQSGNMLCAPGDLEELGHGLIALLGNRELSLETGRKNQQVAIERYNIDTNMAKIKSCYLDLL